MYNYHIVRDSTIGRVESSRKKGKLTNNLFSLCSNSVKKDHIHINESYDKGIFRMTNHTKPNGTGLTRLINAVLCSSKGFSYVWKNEAAFRQEALLCALGVPLALFLGDGGVERSLLAGSVLSILLVELINSSIECVVDRIGSEYHEMSGSAKDIGSAAVSMSIILAAIVWILVLWR